MRWRHKKQPERMNLFLSGEEVLLDSDKTKLQKSTTLLLATSSCCPCSADMAVSGSGMEVYGSEVGAMFAQQQPFTSLFFFISLS